MTSPLSPDNPAGAAPAEEKTSAITEAAPAAENAASSEADVSEEVIPLAERPPVTSESSKALADGSTTEPASNSEAEFRHQLRSFDRALAFFTFLLAILLASFTARNSDIWLHLATGRALVDGTYSFGAEPFTYTGGGLYWVNNCWLYDLLSYAIYSLAGGPGLVGIKVALVALTVWFMFRLSRLRVPRDYFLWFPAFCILLAVLAMAPWLSLRPIVVSYLFLVLTLLFLEQGILDVSSNKRQAAVSDGSFESRAKNVLLTVGRTWWPILVLFALWVNLDDWFFFGPAVVTLYALGHLRVRWPRQKKAGPTVSGSGAGAANLGTLLAALAGLSFLVCLVNPHFAAAFRLPHMPGFSGTAAMLEQNDPYWRDQSMSSLSKLYGLWGTYLNPGAVAYYMLLLLGALSFVARRVYRIRSENGTSKSRLLVWIALCLLSVYQADMVAFFAVAAGAITAINFQEINLARYGAQPDLRGLARTRALAVRPLSCFAALGLLVVAWPGWLQKAPAGGDDPRRWDLAADPSLREAALQLGRWRRENRTAELVGFNSSLDVANYCAWFSPEEKTYLTGALHGSRKVIFDFLTLRREMNFPRSDVTRPTPILRQWKIGYVVLDLAKEQRFEPAFHNFFQYSSNWEFDPNTRQWSRLYLKGHVAVFAWNDPGEWDENNKVTIAPKINPLTKQRINLNLLALHPAEDDKAPLETAVDAFPYEVDWWEPFLRGSAAPSLKRDQAGLYLQCFAAGSKEFDVRNKYLWCFAHAGGLVGDGAIAQWPIALGQITGRLDAVSLIPQLSAEVFKPPSEYSTFQYLAFEKARNDGPAAALLLAIRAARQAIADNPYDAAAYLYLGDAYFALYFHTKERIWEPQFSDLGYLRTWQMLSAYKAAVRLGAGQSLANKRLLDLYALLNYPDLALPHMQEHLKYLIQTSQSFPSKQINASVLQLKDEIKRAQQEIKKREALLSLNSGKLTILEQVKLAEQLNLAGKALQILEAKDPSLLSSKEIILKLKLWLQTGQAQKALLWSQGAPEILEQLIGSKDYLEIQASLAAAVGHYALADHFLAEQLVKNVEWLDPFAGTAPQKLALKTAIATMAGQTFLRQIALRTLPLDLELLPWQDMAIIKNLHSHLVENSRVNTLRGVLALEAGQIDKAELFFREALQLGSGPGQGSSSPHMDFPGRSVAENWLPLIELAKAQK